MIPMFTPEQWATLPATDRPPALSVELYDPILADYLDARPALWCDEDEEQGLWVLGSTTYDFEPHGDLFDQLDDPDIIEGLRIQVSATDDGPRWLVIPPGTKPSAARVYKRREDLYRDIPDLEATPPAPLPAGFPQVSVLSDG